MTYQPPQDPWQPVPPPPPPPPSPWQAPTAQFGPPYPTAQVPAGRNEVHGWATVPVGVNGAAGKGPKRPVTRGQKIAGGFLGLVLLCCCGGGLAAVGGSGDDKPAAKESAAAARALAEPSVAQDSPTPSSEPTTESPSPAATTSKPSPAPKPTRSSPKPTPKRTTSAPRTTKPTTTRKCDPNYSGACVPIASDVDCAGGSGNGPAYVQGPVRVVGTDVYDLDRDGDGIACDT